MIPGRSDFNPDITGRINEDHWTIVKARFFTLFADWVNFRYKIGRGMTSNVIITTPTWPIRVKFDTMKGVMSILVLTDPNYFFYFYNEERRLSESDLYPCCIMPDVS